MQLRLGSGLWTETWVSREQLKKELREQPIPRLLAKEWPYKGLEGGLCLGNGFW